MYPGTNSPMQRNEVEEKVGGKKGKNSLALNNFGTSGIPPFASPHFFQRKNPFPPPCKKFSGKEVPRI